MRIRTVCAWCGALISEKDCPETQHDQALAKDRVMVSHGICSSCRQAIEAQYGLNREGGEND